MVKQLFIVILIAVSTQRLAGQSTPMDSARAAYQRMVSRAQAEQIHPTPITTTTTATPTQGLEAIGQSLIKAISATQADTAGFKTPLSTSIRHSRPPSTGQQDRKNWELRHGLEREEIDLGKWRQATYARLGHMESLTLEEKAQAWSRAHEEEHRREAHIEQLQSKISHGR